MKKLLAFGLACMLVFMLAACGGGASSGGAAGGDQVYKVAVLVPFIGDQSYFDTVNSGRLLVEEYPNVETTLIEMTEDKSKWEGFYLDACESGYDLIVGGNVEAEGFLYACAEKYPDQKFYNFDYENPVTLPNVYANRYNIAELGYVAGVLAGYVTQSDMPNANPEKVVGVVLGMDIPGMNEFVGGFCQVLYDMGVKVLIGYTESFSDSAKGKEVALNMYNQGADVVWQVAGGAGIGVFEAAAETGHYAIGVDSDQTISMAGKPDLAATIITSMYKDCGSGVKNAVDMLISDSYKSGEERIGLNVNAVGLIDNEQYRTLVPQDIRDKVNDAIEEVRGGTVTIINAKEDEAAWKDIKAKATA